MSRFLVTRYHSLTPYVPGEQPQDRQYIKLNTNESPFPPSQKVVEALNSAEVSRLNLYSDPDARAARRAIGNYYGLPPDCILLGNGSDEVLALLFEAFCDEHTPPCFPCVSYGFYKVFARNFCLTPKMVPVSKTLQIDQRDYEHIGGTVFIANPNAPTGQSLAPAEIERILITNPDHVVVIDEAYVDFGGETCLPLLKSYDNLAIVRTMSKSRSLAGARLGYLLANEALIQDVNAMRFSFNPYNVNRLSLLAAESAIQDEAYFISCVSAIKQNRAFTEKALAERGFTVLKSAANFLFVKPEPLSGGEYYERLRASGLLVRHFSEPELTDFVRISIGSRADMEALLAATDRIMGGQML